MAKMIAEKFDVNTKDSRGNTLLIAICGEEEQELSVDRMVKALIAAGADVTVANEKGTTALHEAADSGFCDSVKMLLAAGADVLAQDKDGKTALDLATRSRHHDCKKVLSEAGASAIFTSFMSKNKELFPNYDDTLAKIKKAKKPFWAPIFNCGITGKVCNDPVAVDDGYIYERAALMEHLKKGQKSPKTKEHLYFGDKPQAMTVYKRMIADIIINEANHGNELPEHCKCPLDDSRYYGVVLCVDGYLYNKRALKDDDGSGPTRGGMSTEDLRRGRMIDMPLIQEAISDYKDEVESR